MKYCTICKKEKHKDEFNKKASTKDLLQNKCRECSRAQSKKHYKENKRYYLDKNKRKRERLKKLLVELKSKPCMDCKQTFPSYVMDWDHQGNKDYIVSRLIRHGSVTRLLNEIKKCELVCANCHRIRTHG